MITGDVNFDKKQTFISLEQKFKGFEIYTRPECENKGTCRWSYRAGIVHALQRVGAVARAGVEGGARSTGSLYPHTKHVLFIPASP